MVAGSRRFRGIPNFLCYSDLAKNGAWDALDTSAGHAVRMAILGMIGRAYLPFLIKNADAIAAGRRRVNLARSRRSNTRQSACTKSDNAGALSRKLIG
jgi:hypothetical protein